MTTLFENDRAFVISSEIYFNSVLKITEHSVKINPNLFKIYHPYYLDKKTKTKKNSRKYPSEPGVKNTQTNNDLSKDILLVKQNYLEVFDSIEKCFPKLKTEHLNKNNLALDTAKNLYTFSGKTNVNDLIGSNIGAACVQSISDYKFVFPENCIFYSKNVSEINVHLNGKKFDLIVLDPPWWNKYIRRKNCKGSPAYKMMFNTEIKNLPIEGLLSDNGVVIVWCTNCSKHFNDLIEDIFPKWGVHYVGKWYWLKVTVSGKPICGFSKPSGKQPFEQIIFGYKNPNKSFINNGKLLISVPSAIHSHKPPLTEVVKSLIPDNPKCLEIFARNLLPNWTSYGDEVLRFQHESFYNFK